MSPFLRVPQRVHNAVILMADLAERGPDNFVSLNEVANKNNLSQGFLEEIVLPLRQAGLVKARRGISGGYALNKPPSEISIGEIVAVLDGPISFVSCLNGNNCELSARCSSQKIWRGVQDKVREFLDGMTLADLVDSSETKQQYVKTA